MKLGNTIALVMATSFIGCAGEATTAQPSEADLVGRAYDRLAYYSQGTETPLTITLGSVTTTPYEQLRQHPLSDLLSAPDSTLDVVRVLHTDEVQGGGSVASARFSAQWQDATSVAPMMAQWSSTSLEKALELENRSPDVLDVVTMSVTVSTGGKSIRYRTAALFHKTGAAGSLEFLDVVLGATNLATALTDTLPNAVDAPKPSTPTTYSAQSSCRSGQQTGWDWYTDQASDTNQHSRGKHWAWTEGGWTCWWSSDCTSGCRASYNLLHAGEDGTGNLWNHQFNKTVAEHDTTAYNGSATCYAAQGFAVCSQVIFPCGISVSLGWTGNGFALNISTSAQVVWQWEYQNNHTCAPASH